MFFILFLRTDYVIGRVDREWPHNPVDNISILFFFFFRSQFIYRQSLTRFILKMTYVVIYLFCVVSTALLSCQPRVSLTK